MTSLEMRQVRAALRAQLQEARQLRQELASQGLDVRELDQVIADLSVLDDERRIASLADLDHHLQSGVLDRLKEYEFALRQRVRAEETRRLFLSGAGGVPAEFRELVERYYRELSEGSRR